MMSDKKILAIETSGELCSVSLSFSYNVYDERNIMMKHVHSEKLVPMIDELIRANNVEAKELDCIAVSIGPGSFTGLRIGMTAAKGIAFAANLPIVPVSSFEALGFEISSYLPNGISFCIANNANIEECYFKSFVNQNGYTLTGDEPKLVNKNKLDGEISKHHQVYGNCNGVDSIKNISSPNASSIAKWTYLFGEDLLTFDYDYLEPNYLKKFKVRQNK